MGRSGLGAGQILTNGHHNAYSTRRLDRFPRAHRDTAGHLAVRANAIVRQPRILSSEWMLIGRQVDTGFGGRIDLLALAPDGSLVLVELKRDRTPREVVAQALDYAAWVEGLAADDIVDIYSRFRPGQNLTNDFRD